MGLHFDRPGINRYLSEINRVKLLTHEEEMELARRIKQNDKRARARFIVANLRFVVNIAWRYKNRGLSLEDLIGEGNLGLIKAVEKYDETRGFTFAVYAQWWIRQSILNALRKKINLIRLPDRIINNKNRLNKEIKLFEQEYNRSPSDEELAERMDIDCYTVADLRKQIDSLIIPLDKSLEGINSNNSGKIFSLFSVIAEDSNLGPDKILEKELSKKEVRELLDGLSVREAMIVRMFYGVDGERVYTAAQIAVKVNMPVAGVKYIRERAIRRLRRSERVK